MALTVTVAEHLTHGNKVEVRGTIGFDSSYPTGGETLAATTLGLAVIDHIEFMNGRHGVLFYTDTALPASSINVEILCPTGGAAPTSLAAPSVIIPTPTGTVTVLATSAQPGLTETGGIGVELGNTADASSITAVPFTAYGA